MNLLKCNSDDAILQVKTLQGLDKICISYQGFKVPPLPGLTYLPDELQTSLHFLPRFPLQKDAALLLRGEPLLFRETSCLWNMQRQWRRLVGNEEVKTKGAIVQKSPGR